MNKLEIGKEYKVEIGETLLDTDINPNYIISCISYSNIEIVPFLPKSINENSNGIIERNIIGKSYLELNDRVNYV